MFRTERPCTWWWRLDLGLLLLLLAVSVEGVWWRFFTPLHFTLISEQVLDVLLLQRARGAARCSHVQMSGELAPLLILIHLHTERRGYSETWESKKRTRAACCFKSLLHRIFRLFGLDRWIRVLFKYFSVWSPPSRRNPSVPVKEEWPL